ncbi:hypothetical protein [uncultured Ferrimonas sp.]|uniref:hypothetical protein n=1 Tax=uncultured Ferrimonas sp. TaxID=432640 RepID=UPI002606D03A|nr:hypothetical protein [uncultured Ferrimonas sp.]
MAMDIETIKQDFFIIQDECQSVNIDYPQFGILFDAVCLGIAGARDWMYIREYILGHHERFLNQELFEMRGFRWAL